ncbi:MAG: discoidin domain-containing protein [Phycisphaerae bacterium]|nr:discoidin domain-containing protein [Phycisphaerae bacterium]
MMFGKQFNGKCQRKFVLPISILCVFLLQVNIQANANRLPEVSEGEKQLKAHETSPNHTEEWEVLNTKLANYQSVYDGPIPSLQKVNTIPDAPICGGGKLTLALDGTHRQVNYHVTKPDFWKGTLGSTGIFPKTSIVPARFCRLGFTIHNAASQPDGYQHVQDMTKAEVRSTLPLTDGILHVRSIALAQKDLVVFEMKAEGSGASVNVRLQADNENNNFFIIEGVHDDKTVWLRKEHSSHVNVNTAAALRILGGKNVRTTDSDKIEANLSFTVEPSKPVMLVLSAGGGKDEYQHLADAITALDRVDINAIPELLKEHAAWWQNYWLKSWIDMTDPAIERYYYGALYVLGCSIDLDSRVAPGLAGAWITHTRPIWGGNYTMNYNGEAPFWSLFSANRGEMVLPYARVCMDYIPSGRRLAKELGTKGIVMPVMIGPWGVCAHGLNGDALGQKSNATMAALSLIWNYEFYRDRSFLEQYAYPYIRELMDFWEENLVLDDTGRYVIQGAARERDTGDLNPGNTLGYTRYVLHAAIDFSEELGVDKDRRGLWQDYLDRLSDYPTVVVNGNMCFTEAENRMEVSTFGTGDNPVVLDHVYPGGSLDESNSERNRIVARNTLSYLGSWNQGNSFSRIFSQAVRAEWPGEDLLELFKKRITSGSGPHEIVRKNNTFINKDHSFEGVGGIEFINTMLAHAHGGVLKVFDVWPENRDASFERLRVRGAFLVSGALKGGNVSHVEVLSEKGGKCRMESCWPGHDISVDQVKGDRFKSVKISGKAGVYAWDTVPGGVYKVTVGKELKEAVGNPPVMLVPIIDARVQEGVKYTDAALDVLLTPENQSTKLDIDMILSDESRLNCTSRCRFSSRDKTIAKVNSGGKITGVGSGWTTVDVEAKIDGVQMSCSVLVYVLENNVIGGVDAVCTDKNMYSHHEYWKNSPKCLVGAGGTDGPDITSLHRASSYQVGMFQMNKGGKDSMLVFDFGKVYSLDEMWVWNYNCPDNFRVLWWVGGLASGMRDVTIEYSEDGNQWTPLKSGDFPFRLARATGTPWMPATNLDDGKNSPVRFNGIKARYVRLTANPEVGVGNWGGTGFGLSEVRFTCIK